MAKSNRKIDENDFDALDRLAHSVTPERMRPLSPPMRRRWQDAKRARSRKPVTDQTVPTMIAVEAELLRLIDTRAKETGVSRSQFLAHAARRELGLAR